MNKIGKCQRIKFTDAYIFRYFCIKTKEEKMQEKNCLYFAEF